MILLRKLLFIGIICLTMLFAGNVSAQVAPLPEGAQTNWIVDEPEEIIIHLAFDPATVANKLPESLKFITFKTLAESGNPGAREHIDKFPDQGNWGISFFEIVRQTTFEIDGRVPHFPENGAVALWFAGVQPVDPDSDVQPGRLALELWMPDSAYISYMRGKGHYATYADVHLSVLPDSTFVGSVQSDGIYIEGKCKPEGNGRELGPGASVLYPPATSELKSVVRTSYFGHKEKACREAEWDFKGSHPLSSAVRVGSPVFQFGYDFKGGVYGQ